VVLFVRVLETGFEAVGFLAALGAVAGLMLLLEVVFGLVGFLAAAFGAVTGLLLVLEVALEGPGFLAADFFT
jgi:hypothetical protein